MEKRKQLFVTGLVYGMYVVLILTANILMEMSVEKDQEIFEALSGVIFGFIAIPIFSIVIPFILAKKWGLEYGLWPKSKNIFSVLSILVLFVGLINYQAIKALLESSIGLRDFGVHFVSVMLFHTSYYPLLVVLMLPVLRKFFNIPMAIGLTALAFSIYHLAQFHFYPAGLTLGVQLFLFIYFCASLLLYLWCESIVLVAVAHQFSGGFAVALNGSVHKDLDFLFYLTLLIMVLYFGWMVYQIVSNKHKYHKDWWFHLWSPSND